MKLKFEKGNQSGVKQMGFLSHPANLLTSFTTHAELHSMHGVNTLLMSLKNTLHVIQWRIYKGAGRAHALDTLNSLYYSLAFFIHENYVFYQKKSCF